MPTHSLICLYKNGVGKAIYCHYDGYINYTGRILYNYYDEPHTEELISIGNVKMLHFNKNQTEFYSDGNEFTPREFTKWGDFVDFFKSSDADVGYVMKHGVWYFCTRNDMSLSVLEGELEEDSV